MNPKVFSLEDANALIPDLEKLVSDLAKKKKEMQKRHDDLLVLDLISGGVEDNFDTQEGKEYVSKSEELEDLILSFEKDIMQINQMGCFLRDIEKGVVDFFYVFNKELVYLCWKKGEKKVRFYHDLDDSHESRKPI